MEKYGFAKLGTPVTNFNCCYELTEVLEYAGIKSLYEILDKKPIGVNILQGDDFMLLSVVNISRIHKEVKDVEIKINAKFSTAVLSNPYEETEFEIKDGVIKIPLITDGTFVMLK